MALFTCASSSWYTILRLLEALGLLLVAVLTLSSGIMLTLAKRYLAVVHASFGMAGLGLVFFDDSTVMFKQHAVLGLRVAWSVGVDGLSMSWCVVVYLTQTRSFVLK